MLIGMSLIQGGSGYPFFAPAVYDYICGQEVCNIVPTIDEIPDAQLKTALVEVSNPPPHYTNTCALIILLSFPFTLA